MSGTAATLLAPDVCHSSSSAQGACALRQRSSEGSMQWTPGTAMRTNLQIRADIREGSAPDSEAQLLDVPEVGGSLSPVEQRITTDANDGEAEFAFLYRGESGRDHTCGLLNTMQRDRSCLQILLRTSVLGAARQHYGGITCAVTSRSCTRRRQAKKRTACLQRTRGHIFAGNRAGTQQREIPARSGARYCNGGGKRCGRSFGARVRADSQREKRDRG